MLQNFTSSKLSSEVNIALEENVTLEKTIKDLRKMWASLLSAAKQ